MAEQPNKEQPRGLPDGLRTAIERTFSATAEGAAGTRERAGGMLDEVARRGREARESASKVIEAIEGMRLANRDDLRELSDRVERLSARVDELERKPKVEG